MKREMKTFKVSHLVIGTACIVLAIGIAFLANTMTILHDWIIISAERARELENFRSPTFLIMYPIIIGGFIIILGSDKKNKKIYSLIGMDFIMPTVFIVTPLLFILSASGYFIKEISHLIILLSFTSFLGIAIVLIKYFRKKYI